MEIPSINLGRGKLPSALDMPSVNLKQPTAEMPIFPPVVIPPSNLVAPAGVTLDEAPAEKEEEETEAQTVQPSLRVPVIDITLPLPTAEVVATATYAAVAAVATTTLATPFFNKIKKQLKLSNKV